jgi:penicillin amidase
MTRTAARIAIAFVASLSLGCGSTKEEISDSQQLRASDGEWVRIERDAFGTPHIFARSNWGLFEAYGYVVAEDRLWQLELFRRTARGTVAEIFGVGSLVADQQARLHGYTNEELDSQFAQLTVEEQRIFDAYAHGVNRYVQEVIVPDPANKLPFEFHVTGIGVPDPWTAQDSVNVSSIIIWRRFNESSPPSSGGELINQDLLSGLIARHGEAAGWAIFNDLAWINDPDAPTTIPADDPGCRSPSPPLHAAAVAPNRKPPADTPPDPSSTEAEASRIWQSLGVPTKLGSFAWVITPEKSAEGVTMLMGGPQAGRSVPEIVHEVQLTGGSGFHVSGAAVSGIPAVIIGRNQDVAWTLTTAAAADSIDTYIETLCDGGRGYIFNGSCVPFERRVEVIQVRGQPPNMFTVLRSIHGPIFSTGPTTVASKKRNHWMKEGLNTGAALSMNRATNLSDFESAVRRMTVPYNVLYADKDGNIGYWQSAALPVRPDGFDIRFPLPGDGSAEWTGAVQPLPRCVNPARGWIANWNSKPSVDYNNPDRYFLGKQFRLRELEARLLNGLISLEDMRDIPIDIARTDLLYQLGILRREGRASRFIKPYLLAALEAVPPSHPLAAQAINVLRAWQGNAFSDALTSTELDAGEVIFSEWVTRMQDATFLNALGPEAIGEARPVNVLLHLLDDALGGGSGVPPGFDYFNGRDPNAVMSASFDDALTALGPDPAAWWSRPRPRALYTHALPAIGTVANIPLSNRSTFAQIVLFRPDVFRESNFSLGQSGFIRLVPPNGFELDPHFLDLLPLFRQFQYRQW